MTTTTREAEATKAVEDRQRALDELEAELAGLPDQIVTARRSGDFATWAQLEQHKEDLPAELDAARLELCRAQLEAAWLEAERLAATASEAEAARDAASEAHRAWLTRPGSRIANTPEELGDMTATTSRLHQERAVAQAKFEIATHAVLVGLVEVEALEDAITSATGERPAHGPGLRAPVRILATTANAYHPGDYRPIGGSPAIQGAKWRTFPAGTRPPRWFAYQYAASNHLWMKEETP